MFRPKSFLLLLGTLLVSSCKNSSDTLFTRLDADDTGIAFNNFVEEDAENNVLKYGYFYNGGGVGAGDFNNDGLVDLYFTGNMVADKLYLNTSKPDEGITFEDVTDAAGIKHSGWKTGVSVVDINNDGWLDIYVCRSGAEDPNLRKNLLYINQGKTEAGIKFVEKAAEYGLDDPSYTTQAAFFDYDRDGDLDCFLLNHSIQDYAGFSQLIANYRQQPDPRYGSKLMRNEGGKYVDVSQGMGLINNVLSFGLGVNVADFNNDGWLDLYVSNDYNENDYFYLNQEGKTFKESIRETVGSTSLYSMGTDAADINNDGWADMVTLDMLPNQNERIKLTAGDDNYDKYQSLLRAGFHHQTMRNMLQLNMGVNPNKASQEKAAIPVFSEIGQLAGVSNTDWSWSALFADFDNDGFKDLFVTNGYARDYTNMEFLKYSADIQVESNNTGKVPSQMDVIAKMPPINEPNYMFRNRGVSAEGAWEGSFDNKVKDWGFDQPSQSNGAIYADLDNDGDLDLVTNNTNEKAFVYQNNAQQKSPTNHLSVALKAPSEALKMGTKVTVFTKKGTQTLEFQPVRGFQSAMYVPLHFGLADVSQVDSLIVKWPDQKTQVLKNPQVNQTIQADYAQAMPRQENIPALSPFLTYTGDLMSVLPTNAINDFKIQTLLPQMLSGVGPCLAKGDFNGDGRLDVFVGAPKGQADVLYLQNSNGFVKSPQPEFEKDASFESSCALLFDADGDKDLDVAVVSGGYALSATDSLLQPRLYLNHNGKLKRHRGGQLSALRLNATVVKAADIDADGDQDLFIGAHCVPGRFPEAQASVLLRNEGQGNFSVIKSFAHSSLVTGAAFSDFNNDKKPDLLLVGEWMKPMVYLNQGDKWIADETKTNALLPTLAHSLLQADLDGDGDDDFVLGNMGLNTQYHVTSGDKLQLYYKDFTGNGGIVPIVSLFQGGKEYPYASRDELLDQMPFLKKKFPDYVSYSKATLSDILGNDILKTASQLSADELRTGILWNEKGTMVFKALPTEAQYAPVYALEVMDVDKDQKLDLIIGGNIERARIRLGKMDASRGQLFFNKGSRTFAPVGAVQSGLYINGELRSMAVVNDLLVFGVYNQSVGVYRRP